MRSGLLDSLKLALSDSYNIPDSEYKKLSGILLKNGLSDSGFETGLVPIICALIKRNETLPASLDYVQSIWETDNVKFNFVKMIVPMVRDRVVLLRKVKNNTFFNSQEITKRGTENVNNSVFIVVYPTEVFTEVFNAIKSAITAGESIKEGVSLTSKMIPDKVKNASIKVGNYLNKLHMGLTEESYMEDDVTQMAHINFIISDTSEYTCKDSDIYRIAKKHLMKVKAVKEVEAYKEDSKEIFLGIDFSLKEALSGLDFAIYSFMEELEMNYI